MPLPVAGQETPSILLELGEQADHRGRTSAVRPEVKSATQACVAEIHRKLVDSMAPKLREAGYEIGAREFAVIEPFVAHPGWRISSRIERPRPGTKKFEIVRTDTVQLWRAKLGLTKSGRAGRELVLEIPIRAITRVERKLTGKGAALSDLQDVTRLDVDVLVGRKNGVVVPPELDPSRHDIVDRPVTLELKDASSSGLDLGLVAAASRATCQKELESLPSGANMSQAELQSVSQALAQKQDVIQAVYRAIWPAPPKSPRH
jgi:hypothetical protein